MLHVPHRRLVDFNTIKIELNSLEWEGNRGLGVGTFDFFKFKIYLIFCNDNF